MNNRQTLEGSFSAVSKPIFAPKFAFSAFFETYKIDTLLHRSDFKISAKKPSQFQQFWIELNDYSFLHSQILHQNCYFSSEFWWNFAGISRTRSKMSKFLENCRVFVKFRAKFWVLIFVKFPKMIQLFIRADWIIQSSPYSWSETWGLGIPPAARAVLFNDPCIILGQNFW